MSDKANESFVIVYADKTVLKISGLSVKGLDTRQLEAILTDQFGSLVRVIGVTGDSIEMDVYTVGDGQIFKDEQGVIKALALAEGVTVTDLSKIVCSEKVVSADFSDIPSRKTVACSRERWVNFDA